MELATSNYFNTTTIAAVDSNTATVSNMIQWDAELQYLSDGYNNDLTTTTITISFGETKSVDRIALIDHNLKAYRIYYNGTTANAFSFTSTAATTTSIFSSNSETSQYFFCTSVDCSSVSFDLNSTQVADAEKAVGILYIGQQSLDFERVPSAKNYKPLLNPKQINNKMSDGTIRSHTITFKKSVQVKYSNISASFRDSLYTIWKSRDTYTFVGFGTSTGWDAFAFPCVWTGAFEFYKYSDDAVAAGFGGKIKLSETNE